MICAPLYRPCSARVTAVLPLQAERLPSHSFMQKPLGKMPLLMYNKNRHLTFYINNNT